MADVTFQPCASTPANALCRQTRVCSLWTRKVLCAMIPPIVPAEPTKVPEKGNDSTASSPSDREKKIAGTNIDLPSVAYQKNLTSYTYRLSELVFGSLLASYILGFFGFGIGLVGGTSEWAYYQELFSSLKLLKLGNYLIISGTFAYLTAAYYVTYHNSILTMPQIASHKLRTDFGIALLQAVLFGLSMLQPDGFLFFVGISLLRVFWRQWDVFKELSEMFQRAAPQAGGHQIDHKVEQKRTREILLSVNKNPRYSSCLDGWLPVGGGKFTFAVVLILLGGVSELRHFTLWGKAKLPQNNVSYAQIEIVVYLTLFAVVWFSTNRVFKKGAVHPLDMGDGAARNENQERSYAIDSAAQEVMSLLRTPK